LAAGILAIAQVYFFVWVGTTIFTIFIFTLRSKRTLKQAINSSLYTFLGSLTGIVAMLLPIYREIPRFVHWFTNVASAKGLYGTGEPDILSLDMVFTAFDYWRTSLQLIMLVLILTLIAMAVFAWLRKKSSERATPSTYAMLAGLILHTGLLLLMLIKTAGKLRYSLSLAATLPVLILLVLKLSDTTFWERLKFSRIAYTVIIIGTILTLAGQIAGQQKRALEEIDGTQATSQALTRVAKELGVPKKAVVMVYAYGVPIQCSGMLEAMDFTGAFMEEITRMCPNQHAIFDTATKLNTAIPLVDIKDINWDLVVWPGNGTDLPVYLESVGATTIPKEWHIRRSKWFFIHSNLK